MNTDIASILARVTLGAVLIAHGLLKYFVLTMPGTAGFFSSVGFPGWTAYIVAPAEVLLGAALILGIKSRWAAIASLPILLGALYVHSGNGWLFTNTNGGWEFPAVLVMLAAVVASLGDGRFAITRAVQRA